MATLDEFIQRKKKRFEERKVPQKVKTVSGNINRGFGALSSQRSSFDMFESKPKVAKKKRKKRTVKKIVYYK